VPPVDTPPVLGEPPVLDDPPLLGVPPVFDDPPVLLPAPPVLPPALVSAEQRQSAVAPRNTAAKVEMRCDSEFIQQRSCSSVHGLRSNGRSNLRSFLGDELPGPLGSTDSVLEQ
jgi:hypothetical protein